MPDQPNPKKENQDLILAIYEAGNGDAAAKAEVASRAVELYRSRQEIFQEYNAFVDGFTAVLTKGKKKRLKPEIIAGIIEEASFVPIPRYDPTDDFGIMENIFNAALNNNFKALFDYAANTIFPVDRAKQDSNCVKRAITVLELFREAKSPKKCKYAMTRLKVYKGTLTRLNYVE